MGPVTDKPPRACEPPCRHAAPKLRRECLVPIERKATETLIERRGELTSSGARRAMIARGAGAAAGAVLVAGVVALIVGPIGFTLTFIALLPAVFGILVGEGETSDG